MARNSARPARAGHPPVDILDRLLNLPSLALAILKIRIYVADYVLSKVCDLTHQFEFK